MGRARKYATEEEAHEAKKQQMRDNYQKRKAAKKDIAKEDAKIAANDGGAAKPESHKQNRKKKPLAESIHEPPSAEYLKMTKEELLEKFGSLLDSIK